MTGIKTTTGLVSGIDIGGLVTALIAAERAPAARMESRLQNLQATQAGLGTLQAQLLGLTTSLSRLADRNTFSSLVIQNSDPTQVSVTPKLGSLGGTYQFQTLQLASSQRIGSRGFSTSDTPLGLSGSIVLARGGDLAPPAKLDLLNQGQGIRRGQIQLTDRSGATATVDLRNVVSTADVVSAINASGLGIIASTENDHFVLRDTTGQSGNLSVTEVGNGNTAADLGLRQTVSADRLVGSDVFQVTDQFTFNLLDDGNGLRRNPNSADLLVHLADGSQVEVNLDGAVKLGDVITKLNEAGQTGSKFTAALTDGRIVIQDQTTGTDTLSVTDVGASNAASVLGLNGTATGNTLESKRLAAGLNSVLLRNLKGGAGISQPGEISLTDRTGATATVDLSSAETLDEVLSAINFATTTGNVKLQIKAEISSDGGGLVLRDTSGSTASSLIVADVGAGTTATDLGIAVNDAVTTKSSGNLGLRRVNEATSLNTYSPRGTRVSSGSFRITDSAGNDAIVSITSAVQNIGEVIDRINTTGLAVTARLSSTGDGIEVVDNSGGTGTFAITDVGGKAAADLHLTGAAVIGGDGKPKITARQAISVKVEAGDTLTGIATKINNNGGTIRALVAATGSALNGYRLEIQSTIAGQSGRFHVEEGSLDFGFASLDAGQDAVLRIGGDSPSAAVLSGSSNTFTNAIGALDVTVQKVGTSAATVTANLDRSKVQSAIEAFVNGYNSYVDKAAELTKYDPSTQKRAALTGVTTPLTIQTRFAGLVNKLTGASDAPIRSLADIGVKLSTGGKLSFDPSKLDAALTDHPDDVRTLFSDTTNGFGKLASSALDTFTNETNGRLTLQINALQASGETLQKRIDAFDAQLEVRKTRLELQFTNMETALNNLQSQQTALSGLANVLANYKSTK